MSASTQAARSLELVRPLAFFDLETTGVDVAVDRIVEIAVLKLLPDGTEEALHTLINPGVPIPASASEVHGICDGDVQGKPTFGQIAERLAQFLKGCDLAGFNVMRFDLPLLKAEFRRAGLAWSEENHKLVDAHIVYQEKERRETIHWDQLLDAGSEAEGRARGTLRLEGKEYIVKDGDVMHIRHSG